MIHPAIRESPPFALLNDMLKTCLTLAVESFVSIVIGGSILSISVFNLSANSYTMQKAYIFCLRFEAYSHIFGFSARLNVTMKAIVD